MSTASTSITFEDLEHYGLKARELCRTEEVSADQYESLGREAEAEKRYYAAGVYFKLAEAMAAGDDERSLGFSHLVVEMMKKVEAEQATE